MAYEVTTEQVRGDAVKPYHDTYEVFDSPSAQEDARSYLWDLVATWRDDGYVVLNDDHDSVTLADGPWLVTIRVNEVDVEWSDDGAVSVTATS